jgi:hypothetical protein
MNFMELRAHNGQINYEGHHQLSRTRKYTVDVLHSVEDAMIEQQQYFTRSVSFLSKEIAKLWPPS